MAQVSIVWAALEPTGEGTGGEVTPEKVMALIVMIVLRMTMGGG